MTRRKNKGHVYVATNRVNGKQYVGLTTTSLERRKWFHRQTAESGGGTSLHAAIRRFGWEAFDWKILHSARSPHELAQQERHWIKSLGTRYPDGYNHTAGGELPDYLTERPQKRRTMLQSLKHRLAKRPYTPIDDD